MRNLFYYSLVLLLFLDVISEFGSVLPLSQVHRVFSQGAASQVGTVSRGDFLLSLNGASLAGLAHGDVLKALHQAQLHKEVLLVIKKGSDQPRPSSRQELPTANGKGLVSRKTSPLEPGTGKKQVQQLRWPELFVMVLARMALITLNKKETLPVQMPPQCRARSSSSLCSTVLLLF